MTLLPFLPSFAVANQQGLYLAKLLNLSKGGAIPDEAKPFRYRHLGSLAYIGGDAAVADFTGTFNRGRAKRGGVDCVCIYTST
jgi:NADH dehydrogenase FAD-containing subunit